MSGHVVVPVEPCEYSATCGEWCRALDPYCLGDGTHVLLDKAVPVERTTEPIKRRLWPDPEPVWVEVESVRQTDAKLNRTTRDDER